MVSWVNGGIYKRAASHNQVNIFILSTQNKEQFMNIYVSKEIQEKWCSHEFRGKIKISQAGFKYCEAYHKTLKQTFFYIFGADACIDKESILAGAPELIFDDINNL